MNFINSIVHSPTMGHRNNKAVRKLRCYESIHENTSFLFVHVSAHSFKSVIFFTYFFKVYSRENKN